jgi:spectrin beta
MESEKSDINLELENESLDESKTSFNSNDSINEVENMNQDNNEMNTKEKEIIDFNDEEIRINSITDSFEKALEFEDFGSTLDNVKALIKRHDYFIAILLAQDERVHLFNDMAEKLIHAKHYDSPSIDAKRKQVIQRRQAVKEKALLRKQLLNDALIYQEFKVDAEEFLSWCTDRKKVANDESYKDLTNMERKLQKHEAFEAELGANQSRLATINQTGKELISNSHFASDQIEQILEAINNQWIELCTLTDSRGKCLRQAYSQLTYNKTERKNDSKN